MFSDRRPRQEIYKMRCFGDSLRFHHQGSDISVLIMETELFFERSDFINFLTRLSVRVNFTEGIEKLLRRYETICVMGGTTRKCNGIAEQLNVNCCYYSWLHIHTWGYAVKRRLFSKNFLCVIMLKRRFFLKIPLVLMLKRRLFLTNSYCVIMLKRNIFLQISVVL